MAIASRTPFSTDGTYSRGIEPPTIFIELEAGPARRLDLQLDIAIHAAAAGLPLEAARAPSPAGDRLAVGHLRAGRRWRRR